MGDYLAGNNVGKQNYKKLLADSKLKSSSLPEMKVKTLFLHSIKLKEHERFHLRHPSMFGSINEVFVTTPALQLIRLGLQIHVIVMRGIGLELVLAVTCAACTKAILSKVFGVMYQPKHVLQLVRIRIAFSIGRCKNSMLGKRDYVAPRGFFSGHFQLRSGFPMMEMWNEMIRVCQGPAEESFSQLQNKTSDNAGIDTSVLCNASVKSTHQARKD